MCVRLGPGALFRYKTRLPEVLIRRLVRLLSVNSIVLLRDDERTRSSVRNLGGRTKIKVAHSFEKAINDERPTGATYIDATDKP